MTLSEKEKNKAFDLVVNNPDKACALVQHLSDLLQLVSCNEYHKRKELNTSLRTLQYKSNKMRHVVIADRTLLTWVQD